MIDASYRIKSKKVFRLFLELKRFYNYISIEVDSNIDVQSGIKAFCINGVNIVVNRESIMSVIDNSVISISKDNFIDKPMKCIKELLKR